MGGFWMVSLRAGLAYVISVTTALVVDRQYRKYGNALLAPLAIPVGSSGLPLVEPHDVSGHQHAEVGARQTAMTMTRLPFAGPGGNAGPISETGAPRFRGHLRFSHFGALLSAYMRLVLIQNSTSEFVQALQSSPYLAIGFMMGLAIVLCLCSEADAFVAANMGNVPPAAKLAFLVLGPMLDLKLYMMYTRVFRPRLIWTIIPCVVVQVYIYSLLIYFAWSHWMGNTPAGNVRAHHRAVAGSSSWRSHMAHAHHHADGAATTEQLCTIGVCGAIVWSP